MPPKSSATPAPKGTLLIRSQSPLLDLTDARVCPSLINISVFMNYIRSCNFKF